MGDRFIHTSQAAQEYLNPICDYAAGMVQNIT
jgi:hypothetical protein